MLRKVLEKRAADRSSTFRRRGHEIQRIETFSDAVFAFAVTLLTVSLEVPKSFDELVVGMRGFFAFGICFTLLVVIWHEQNLFYRRYGLDDTRTLALNIILDFVVLFYVYPLKFLFTMVFSDEIYGPGRSPLKITEQQVPALMMIYAAGFLIIYLLFFSMYYHALRSKDKLALTEVEQFDTRTKMYAKLVFVLIGLLSILLAYLLPSGQAGWAGLAYMLIWPALTFFYKRRAKIKKRRRFSGGDD